MVPTAAYKTLVLFERHEETIADNLKKAGGVWAGPQRSILRGQTIWIADAHRDDRERFVVRANEKLTAFFNLNLQFLLEGILS